MKRNSFDISISIPLKSRDEAFDKVDVGKGVKLEFATQYLEKLGINANEKLIKSVLQKTPIERDWKATPTWKVRGAVSNSLQFRPKGAKILSELETLPPKAHKEMNITNAISNLIERRKPDSDPESNDLFDQMKRKFIPPFKKFTEISSTKLHQQQHEFFSHQTIPDEVKDQMRSPPTLTTSTIESLVRAFVQTVPINPSLKQHEQDELTTFLSNQPLFTLIGLCCHHCYWKIIRPFVQGAPLDQSSVEDICLSIMRIWAGLEKSEKGPYGGTNGIKRMVRHLSLGQLMVRACVELIIQRTYPSLVNHEMDGGTTKDGLPITRDYSATLLLADRAIEKILDPGGHYCQLPNIISSAEGVKLAQQTTKRAARGKHLRDQRFMVSTHIKSLLSGKARSPLTRNLLAKQPITPMKKQTFRSPRQSRLSARSFHKSSPLSARSASRPERHSAPEKSAKLVPIKSITNAQPDNVIPAINQRMFANAAASIIEPSVKSMRGRVELFDIIKSRVDNGEKGY
eukprot:TRINITY_DN1979_c0_g1_i2.p1 TRINITY_DN1979_c0_g1~~TRINITY_DN1979_c0_g1_i2.p1  ORF type:complete len:514 (+),score=103.33 TRINITY_DN1979_c0_g1_i2:255-1796(+)